ncbi:hypothetical protein NAEGRDRAFT_80641 [Naegleria gruberi]|uniref:Uncharacterized protein n=1 Tax=Naegleria gruberi TaxID=5762 RepID=D2VNG0_NAEGR|nr:uncharacterized protein NAEGRDRAFT_80641 [Naegleria gruberi]EFC41729.1 hypothetical protein NAEGRDRAFT_80641 [Naegleria gruberi]|eukprot:XP_002674473.1 hypothetical protein NAEGRDRAFT_80641 [Naegleria gruberi strain NEG-M]
MIGASSSTGVSRPPLSSSSFDTTTTTRGKINLPSPSMIAINSYNNRQLVDNIIVDEFNQKSLSSDHTISKFSKTSSSSSWFNPVTTIQSLINYSLFLVVVSQLICPVLLPLVLSSFLEKQPSSVVGSSENIGSASDHFVVSFSVGFEHEKRLVTNVNLSATKLIFMLQWLIHIPLVVLPYISLIVNKSYVRESRMMVYWFCILSLFLSNVVVSLKQASFDWISFIPSILESTDISWGGEKLAFNTSIPFIKKQLETSSILPQLLSLLLFTTITLYFIRDVIFGLNVNFRGRDEIVGLREFIEREFSTCLVSPLQAMLKLTSIDSNLEIINHGITNIPQQQQPIVSQKETTQNVPSNKDIQSPNSPTEVNVTPSIETSESPRLAVSIRNTTAKQPIVTVKKPVVIDDNDESDDSDWEKDDEEIKIKKTNDDDEEEEIIDSKFSHLSEKKEKMIAKSDKKTENDETSHSPSPSSDLPSVSESKPHSSILHKSTSPTVSTGVKQIGGRFMERRFQNRHTPETGCNEYQSSLEAAFNKNRNSKIITEPIDLEESNNEEKPKTSEERRKVSFD